MCQIWQSARSARSAQLSPKEVKIHKKGAQENRKVQKTIRSFLSGFVVLDVEVFDFVGLLVLGDDVEELPEAVLLEVLLGQVLEVPLGEGDGGSDYNLGSIISNLNLVSELAELAVDFYSLAQVLGEVGGDEHLIADGLGAVDGEVQAEGLLLFPGADLLRHSRCGYIQYKQYSISNLILLHEQEYVQSLAGWRDQNSRDEKFGLARLLRLGHRRRAGGPLLQVQDPVVEGRIRNLAALVLGLETPVNDEAAEVLPQRDALNQIVLVDDLPGPLLDGALDLPLQHLQVFLGAFGPVQQLDDALGQGFYLLLGIALGFAIAGGVFGVLEALAELGLRLEVKPQLAKEERQKVDDGAGVLEQLVILLNLGCYPVGLATDDLFVDFGAGGVTKKQYSRDFKVEQFFLNF